MKTMKKMMIPAAVAAAAAGIAAITGVFIKKNKTSR